MHWEILDSERRKLLPALKFTTNLDLYLAGGTALALQLGHRKSVDFDFYSPKPLDERNLEIQLVSSIPHITVTHRAAGTLIAQAGSVDLSFFYYPYSLLLPLVRTEYFDLASVEDIAAMKIIAVTQRGVRRDFLDLFMMCQKEGLEQILTWTKKKYPQFDSYMALKALTFFQDADKDESGRGMDLKPKVAWKKVRAFFEKEVLLLSRKKI